MTYITRLTGRKAMSISHIMVMVLTGFVLVALHSSTIQAQWTTNGNNINNTNSGNVGVGGTAPVTRLEVYAPVISTFTGNSRGALSIGVSGSPTNLYYRAIDFLYNDSYGPAARIAMRYDASLGSFLHFGTSNNTLSGVTNSALVIDPNGKVGIGTTSPGAPLDINSNQNGYAPLLVLNNPSNGASAQAVSSFYEGLTQKAKFAVNSSGATGFVGGPNAFQVWNFSNAPIVFGTNSAERLRIDASGSVGIGTSTPNSSYRLDVNGNTNVTGNLNVTGNIAAKYQDVAEWVHSSQELPAGTVVVLDQTKSNQVIASSQAYDTRVAGVISLQPGIALGESGAGKVLVATTGRVRIKVDAARGAIQVGDLLVTSDVPGVAMKSQPIDVGGVQVHRPGTLIGKALEPLAKGTGEILVLLSLQ